MCVRVTCPKCQKPTWSGCGMHIEAALTGVPKDQRCKCREAVSTSSATPTAGNEPAGPKWWPFGR